MKHLLLSAAALALLTGCGNRENANDVDVGRAGEVALEGAENALEDLSNVVLREGRAENAGAALTALSLDSNDSGRVSFAEQDTRGDGATFSDVVIEIPGDDGDDGGQFRVGTLEVDGLDMVDGQASFSLMSLSDITIVPNDPEDAANGQMSIASIELTNPSPALAAWVASLMGDGEPGVFPVGEELSFDSWTLSDLDFNLDDENDRVDLNIASVRLGDVEGGKLAVAALENISMNVQEGEDSAPGMFRLGSLTLTGADISWLEAVSEHVGDEEALVGAVMAKAYENPMEPGYNQFNLEDLAFDMDGVSFALPSMDAFVERNAAGEPTRYVTRPMTMTLSADPQAGEAGGELAGALGMMNYETVELTFASDSRYDPEADRAVFDANDNYVSLSDGFTMRFGGDFSGYEAYAAALSGLDFTGDMDDAASQAAVEEALNQLVLNNFTLQIEDNSIVDRALELYAMQSNMDVATARQQAAGMVAMAPMMAAGSGVDMQMVSSAATALSQFITDPGTLTLSLNPDEPLRIGSLAEIEDPSLINSELLGFSLTHEN